MARDASGFQDYVRGLSAHESPVLIALRELVVLADARGRLSRERLVEAFREAYVRRYSRAAMEGSAEARRLLEIRRMSKDQVRSYLEDQVLARLLAEGWLERSDGAERPDVVSFAPEIWAGIADSRSDATELIDREINRRMRPQRESEAKAALADGSQLRARSLVKIYKKRRVVDDVDLRLRQGEIVGLLGPNGAGKTTTFYMIVGLVPPNAGHVYLDDEDLTNVPMYKRARKGIGYLSQEPSVFRKLTVQQNIEAILETLSLSEEEKKERLESLLDELSIKHLRKNKAYSLSGGERRRLEITRALVTDPKFMLLDEPFAGVDPIAVDDIQRIVAGLKERGLGVLITDHNVRETLSITDRAYIMFDGRIHMEGTSEELVSDPQARKLYLGEDFRL